MSEGNNKLQVSGNVHYLSGPIEIPSNNGGQPFVKSILVINIPAGEKGKPQFVQFETFGNTSSCFAGLQMACVIPLSTMAISSIWVVIAGLQKTKTLIIGSSV